MDQPSPTAPAEQLATIPVHEEQLHVGVRAVETGRGVRVRTEVAAHAEQVDELLGRDELIVTRVPVGRFVAPGEVPAQRQQGDTLVMPVVEEVLVVERRLRIKEELHITRVRRAQRHTERVVLKSEHVYVERFDEPIMGGHTMQHTLVAVFDNRADAQAGMDELLKEGFTREEVRLSEAAADTRDITRGGADGAHDGSFMAGMKNFFGNLFGDDDDQPARQYSEAVMRGSHVLSVTTGDQARVEHAADLIERFGPTDIDEKETQWRGGAGAGEMQRADAGARQQATMQAQSQQRDTGGGGVGGGVGAGADTTAIPIIEEQLKVGKRDVQRGGVRIYQRMVETPVNEAVTLREEHVSVERRPVDQPAASADLAAFQERTLELRETAEEAVVEKSARVVEEVIVGKQVSEREQVISDTVRHTEVDVEQLAPGAADADQAYRSHFTTHYTDPADQYESYAPAYAYGAGSASAGVHRGRAWDEAETSLRNDWEAAHPESAWQKVKAAVRYGWDKMTQPL